jgi:hypothetical protein
MTSPAGRRPSRLRRLRRKTERAVRRSTIRITDRGWLGRTPLRCHVVVCGFARSGSSLLQVMVRACVDDVKTFPDETRALVASRRSRRNEPFMLTKDPDDVMRVDRIREHYRDRSTTPIFVVTIRDPRDALTSVHPGYETSDGYYYGFRHWRRLYQSIVALADDPDVCVVRYEDLVDEPDVVARRLADLIGWPQVRPFSEFDAVAVARDTRWRASLDESLGGLRPLDRSGIGRWRDPVHHDRLRAALEAIPELASSVVALGYDVDESWTATLEHG